MAKTSKKRGAMYYEWGDFRKARNYYQKAFEIYRSVGDSLSLPSVYQNLSAANMNIGLSFIPEKFKIFENLSNMDNQYIVDNSSRYYLDLSLSQIEKSIHLHKKYNMSELYPNLYSYLGVIKAYYGETSIAIEYLKLAIDSLQDHPNINLLARNYINLGIMNYRIGDLDKAEELLKKSISIADSTGDPILLNDAYYSLMDLYEDLSNYEQAHLLAMKIINIKDSVFNRQSMEKIIELETEYEVDKKNNELQLAKAEKQALDKEKNYFIVIILLLSIAVILISVLFYFKSRSNKELNQKSRKLEAMNFELEKTKVKITEANQTKDKFFSIISHDLKNPISSFKQVTSFLDDDYYNIDDNEKIEIIKELRKYSENLYNLLENLLTWSRTQRGNINYNPEYEDLHDIVNYTIEHLNVQSERKNIDIINNIRKRTVAYFDPNLTSTILRNLISNAIKYSNENSKVEISLKNGFDQFYSIDIKDSGIGINENKLNKLFEVGRNISTSGTRNESGTGLGLVICKEFAQRQGGDINVKSKPGIGSTFSLLIKKESGLKDKNEALL
jgi:signal transduction histidine kinase